LLLLLLLSFLLLLLLSQTGIKRSPLGQIKRGLLKRGLHMKFSMTGQEKGGFLMQVTA